MGISRVFQEVGNQVDRMDASLRKTIQTLEASEGKTTGFGKSIISNFEAAINPTGALAQKIELLTKAGYDSAQIAKVWGDQVAHQVEAAKKLGASIDPAVLKIHDLSKAMQGSHISVTELGNKIKDFAENPVGAAKAGIGSLLGALGPTVVGFGAIGGGIAAAGMAMHEFTMQAAETAEHVRNLSYATGMSVEQVQALSRLGKERGLGDLFGTIEKLNIQLGKGEGGPFTEAILKAGIAVKPGADAIYYIEQMRQHYSQIADKSERAQRASGDLGRRLLDLLPIIMNDKEGFDEMLKSIEAGPAVMKGEYIDSLVELKEKIEEHGRVWEGFKNNAASAFAQIELGIMKVIEALSKMMDVPQVKKFLNVISGATAPITAPTMAFLNMLSGGSGKTGSESSAVAATAKLGSVGPEIPPIGLEERHRDVMAMQAALSGNLGESPALRKAKDQLEELKKQAKEFEESEKGGLEWNQAKIRSLTARISKTQELIDSLKKQEEQEKKGAAEAKKQEEDRLRTLAEGARKAMEENAKAAQAPFTAMEQQLKGILGTLEKTTKDSGMITDELRKNLQGLGADIAQFDSVSSLQSVSKHFKELVDHFTKTGEILPNLSALMRTFGGDMELVASSSARLTDVNSGLAFISKLKGELAQLGAPYDPIKQMLEGNMTPEIANELGMKGLDWTKFAPLSNVSGIEKDWKEIMKAGPSDPRFMQAIGSYGGSAGKQAESQFKQWGAVGVGPELIEKTTQGIHEAYLSALRTAQSATDEAQKAAQEQQKSLIQQMLEEFTKTEKEINDRLGDSIDRLSELIRQWMEYLGPNFVGPRQPAGQGGIVITGNIYGYDDFADKVGIAYQDLQRRSDPRVAKVA